MNNRLTWTSAFVISLAWLPCSTQGQDQATKPTPLAIKLDAQHFLLSPEVVIDSKDGTIRLAHSVLRADETGATDHHQTETLNERVWAKKVFVFDSKEIEEAELFVFHGGKQIEFNGQPLKSEKLVSTGWMRAKVPAALLKAGENEVIFSVGGSLLFEPGRQTGRSLKSSDGGKTWSNQALGKNSNLQGEYLCRLRLSRYPPRGWAMSQMIDLWADRASGIATPGTVTSFHNLAALGKGQPEGTRLVSYLRTGGTPSPDDKNWTGWSILDKDLQPDKAQGRQRWAQLKFELFTERPQSTPRIPSSIELTFGFRPDANIGKDKIKVEAGDSAWIRAGSVPFVYQEPSPRLKLLRERYQLDKVIEPGKTEMEQLVLLRHWVRNQWHTAWSGGQESWMPPWDALIILESKDQPDCLTMCTHYAAVFTQCCLALGWNARHCILDHHCVSEVWVNQHKKWVMMDAGNSKQGPHLNLHFEKDGVPLSALELHDAHRTGKTDGIKVCFTPEKLMEAIAPLCEAPRFPNNNDRRAPPLMARPEVIPLAELTKYPVCQIENYRRYAFPGRNNYLTSLYPGELYQGWSSYFYDGYWWVGDSPDAPQISPEYSLHLSPSRPQDIDWSLNWTRIHLARTDMPGEVRIDLETLTPNLDCLEIADEGGKWSKTPAGFNWKLQAGKNVLRVRSVNRFGRSSPDARVEVILP